MSSPAHNSTATLLPTGYVGKTSPDNSSSAPSFLRRKENEFPTKNSSATLFPANDLASQSFPNNISGVPSLNNVPVVSPLTSLNDLPSASPPSNHHLSNSERCVVSLRKKRDNSSNPRLFKPFPHDESTQNSGELFPVSLPIVSLESNLGKRCSLEVMAVPSSGFPRMSTLGFKFPSRAVVSYVFKFFVTSLKQSSRRKKIEPQPLAWTDNSNACPDSKSNVKPTDRCDIW